MTTLSERDIEIGFWRFNKANENGFNPQDTYEIPSNIRDVERLSLNLSTISKATDEERKRLKKEWYPLLPTLSNLKYLWLSEKTNQKLFNELCKMSSLEGLWLKWTSLENIDDIVNLTNLKHIYIGPSSKLKDISLLTRLENLVTVQIEGMPHISDFACLTKLVDIEGLKIEGTLWKDQKVDSLKGFEKFRNIKYLSVLNVQVGDKNVEPIKQLKTLLNLDMGYRWTENDFRELYMSLPNLRYGDVKTVVENDTFGRYLIKSR